VEVHRTEDLVGDPAGIAAGGRLDRRQHIRVGAVRVAQVIVTAVGGFVGQAADDVAAAQFHVPVVGAAQAEVDADAVGQLTLEADQVVGIGRVGEVVTVAGRGEAVEVVGRQAVGGTRGAAAGAAHHATVDVVRGAVLDHHHARNRGVAAEGLDLGHAGSAVEGPVVVDLVVTANEDRGVVDLGLVGRDPVEVERAQARAGLPEGALGAVEAGHRDNGAGIPVVVVVAVGGNAEVLAADLVTGEDHAALGRGSTTDQAGAVGGSAEHDRHFLGVTAADLGRAVAVADLDAVEVLAGDDVHHAADRVGTVHGRSAVGQDLDALDRSQRDGVEVGAGRGSHRVGRGATAVDQHQGTAGAQATQVDRGQR